MERREFAPSLQLLRTEQSVCLERRPQWSRMITLRTGTWSRKAGLSSFFQLCPNSHVCSGSNHFPSLWVFLSVIWGINNWPFLGKHFETIPWKVLVVPVVINITGSPLQARLSLEWKKWADLAWRYCNPMSQSAFFYSWPWWPCATPWSSAFWQLAQGQLVQSKRGPCGHNTWGLSEWSSWGGSSFFLCQMENEVCVHPRKHSMGEQSAVFLPFSLNSYLVWAAAFICFFYLLLTTDISKAHVICLLALNSSAMTETLYFYVCLAEIYSLGREDSNCLLGDFTSTNSFHIHRGFLIELEGTNLHPGLQH